MCARVTHHLRVVRRVHASAIEEEAYAVELLSLAVAEGVHELLELSSALDFEEDLVVVVGDLDVQVLRLRRCLFLVAGGRGRLVGHGDLV